MTIMVAVGEDHILDTCINKVHRHVQNNEVHIIYVLYIGYV